jgi:Flp pilus assembly protein TadD
VLFWFDWQWSQAETELRKALALDPSYAEAHRMLGVVLSHTERHGEAGAAMQRGIDLDPFNPIEQAMASEAAFRRRDFTAALEFANRSLLIDRNFWVGHMARAQAAEQLGQFETALDAASSAERLSGGNSKPVSLRAYVLARAGRSGEARAVIAALHENAQRRYLPPYALALAYAGLGERDATFEWLERAYTARDVHLVFLTIDPKWDSYRADPRFGRLLARCAFR